MKKKEKEKKKRTLSMRDRKRSLSRFNVEKWVLMTLLSSFVACNCTQSRGEHRNVRYGRARITLYLMRFNVDYLDYGLVQNSNCIPFPVIFYDLESPLHGARFISDMLSCIENPY